MDVSKLDRHIDPSVQLKRKMAATAALLVHDVRHGLAVEPDNIVRAGSGDFHLGPLSRHKLCFCVERGVGFEDPASSSRFPDSGNILDRVDFGLEPFDERLLGDPLCTKIEPAVSGRNPEIESRSEIADSPLVNEKALLVFGRAFALENPFFDCPPTTSDDLPTIECPPVKDFFD